MSDSAYKLSEFIQSCAIGPTKVWVTRGAMITAREELNLPTQEAVIGFIAQGGLEKLSFINSEPWENYQGSSKAPRVDAYEFYSGITYGYIAFLYSEQNMWIIKSFKKNKNPDVRNLPFSGLGRLLIKH